MPLWTTNYSNVLEKWYQMYKSIEIDTGIYKAFNSDILFYMLNAVIILSRFQI